MNNPSVVPLTEGEAKVGKNAVIGGNFPSVEERRAAVRSEFAAFTSKMELNEFRE